MDTDNGCLLTYSFSTAPVPLQISASETPTTGRLNIAVAGPGANAYCNQIVIAIPAGSDPACLFSATPSSGISTGKWVISSVDLVTGTDLNLANTVPYAKFTFDCASATDYQITYDLVFGFSGPVTTTIGTYTVPILENSGTTSDPSSFTAKQCAVAVVTAPPQFYLQNFAATAPNTPTAPMTDFANGADIRFSWESNGTFFQLFAKGQTTPISAGTATNFTMTGGVSRDSTFFLVASVSGNPGQDQPSGDYEPIYLYDTLTITIVNPDLTPSTLGASGNASVGGSLSAGALTVNGASTLSSVSVTGNASISGALTAAGSVQTFSSEYGNNLLGWFTASTDPSWVGTTAWLAGDGGIKFFVQWGNPPPGWSAPAFWIDYSGVCHYQWQPQVESSIALKDNIRALTADEASDIFAHLDPVTYTRKDAPNERARLGFIAEHVHPSVASPDGKAIVPDEIVAVLTRVVKEQQQMIRHLEARVHALESKQAFQEGS